MLLEACKERNDPAEGVVWLGNNTKQVMLWRNTACGVFKYLCLCLHKGKAL